MTASFTTLASRWPACKASTGMIGQSISVLSPNHSFRACVLATWYCRRNRFSDGICSLHTGGNRDRGQKAGDGFSRSREALGPSADTAFASLVKLQ